MKKHTLLKEKKQALKNFEYIVATGQYKQGRLTNIVNRIAQLKDQIKMIEKALIIILTLIFLTSCGPGISNYYNCPTYGYKKQPIKKSQERLERRRR